MLKKLVRSCASPSAWKSLSSWRFHATRTWEQCQILAIPFGVRAAVSLWVGEQLGTPAPGGLRRLWLPGVNSAIYYRPRSSDIGAICQVFGLQEYRPSANEQDVRLILDCGANIGCTSLYFLHRYPRAHIIAVEPDPGNFQVCQRNLAPFAERTTLIQAGVWSSEGPLRVVHGAFRDLREWLTQVRPALPGEQVDCPAITIDALLARSGRLSIDLLKIDVEGAEEELFANGADRWLPQTRHLVIELHGLACEQAFWRALSKYNFHTEQSGELLICRGLQPKTPCRSVAPIK